MGIHLLRCARGNKCTRTHDAFGAIVWDVGFHLGWKQLHVFFLNVFNSSHQWVNIVFTKDSIHTLVNVIIVDPTQADLQSIYCKWLIFDMDRF
jgi:hypothetical protein